MKNVNGFLDIKKTDRTYLPIAERVLNFDEFVKSLPKDDLQQQAIRCMDCGTPYCHVSCPLHNLIPDWNSLISENDYKNALIQLHSTNNFPEFTGRICPAPCEAGCTLNIDNNPVSIKTIECAIIDYAFEKNWIKPQIPEIKTDKKIAIIGSGPAGMAAAQQLVRMGHSVVLYEKNKKAGGLLRYGIPDFKLDKKIIDRRLEQMTQEGLILKTGLNVGVDVSIQDLQQKCDAILLTGGCEIPKDLKISGRDSSDIYFAMNYLSQQNKINSSENLLDEFLITAKDKNVIVIGGGDTGSDCIGTAVRQGAKKITQLEIMPKPPIQVDKFTNWPKWEHKFRTSSSQEEGVERIFSTTTAEFINENNKLTAIKTYKVDDKFHKIDDSDKTIDADIVFLAMGFVAPIYDESLQQLDIKTDKRGNIKTDKKYQTNIAKIFSAGDMKNGQSLVVTAINDGRLSATAINNFLKESA
ncbi:MAG: glutamate synthase [Gammaproteobacteria bacterium]|nr:MAG: glutamate synthase [Gammaproteobacteria bacterium]